MVFYFDVTVPPGGDPWTVYMGRDKYENEGLIKHGLPIDVWLHVDDLSSAHVYLRPPRSALPPISAAAPSVTPDDVIAAIPKCVLDDCCQLVKANSIAGSKAASVSICYTGWPNLKKRESMDVGTIGFVNDKAVRLMRHVARDAEAVKRIEKTRREAFPDLPAEKEAWEEEERGLRRAAAAKARAEEKAAVKAAIADKAARSYDALLDPEAMQTAAAIGAKYESAAAYEEDFM